MQPDFYKIQDRVFTNIGSRIFVGGEELKPEERGRLREEAKYISKTYFWELLNNAIVNESSTLALKQSTEWKHIESAKMLYHWAHVFQNALHVMEKE